MLQDIHVSVIGCGAMGGAIISGLLSLDIVSPEQITASDRRESRCLELVEKHGVNVTIDNVEAVEDADVVVLSTKPQVLPQVLAELEGNVKSDTLVLSIVAGAKISYISEGLNHSSIVRSMPNSPSQIGKGITVWTAARDVTPSQVRQSETLLSALGDHVRVSDEEDLDMATALSGSGPAYIFLFMEALVDSGVHLGLSRHLAERLVLQTMKGSVEYVLHSPKHMARLRNQVTSPGGTSAEALYFLEKAGFRTAISRAIWAAYQRSKELGQKLKVG